MTHSSPLREPEVALAASPRDWAQRLHRHLADHGGARVRATILHEQDALAERYDVLVVDDTTSYLSRRLVTALQRSGRRVLGVYDPDDPRGKSELADIGVDAVLAHTGATREFLATITALAAEAVRTAPMVPEPSVRRADTPPPPPAAVPAGRITVVGGPPGGCGATEVAIALAAGVGARGEACVLVDADEVAPSLAQRLALPTYPNLRAAVDAVGQEANLADALAPVQAGGFWALPGPARAADWPHLRAPDVLAVARRLARPGVHVVVNVAASGSGAGEADESVHAATRALLAAADAVVGVGAPTPVGVTRLLDWVADVVQVAPSTPLHLVVNRAPADGFKRGELQAELARTITPATLVFAPSDRRVETAVWDSAVADPGPFVRALAPVLEAALPPAVAPVPRRRGSGLRRVLAPARGAVARW